MYRDRYVGVSKSSRCCRRVEDVGGFQDTKSVRTLESIGDW